MYSNIHALVPMFYAPEDYYPHEARTLFRTPDEPDKFFQNLVQIHYVIHPHSSRPIASTQQPDRWTRSLEKRRALAILYNQIDMLHYLLVAIPPILTHLHAYLVVGPAKLNNASNKKNVGF
ncbi:hypothetical protein ACJX0J_005991 [Zea mays]